MLTIHFNREEMLVNKPSYLNEVLFIKGYIDGCFAVAINNQFIPRLHYTTTLINANDRIEIVMPMQGG